MVRLVGGSHQGEGRVGVYFNSTWGAVCPTGWDIKDAHVICKMLGYMFAVNTEFIYGESSSNQVHWLSDVQCNGREIDITECLRNGLFNHSCQTNLDVGVKCFGMCIG